MVVIRFTEQFDFEYDIQGIVRSYYPGVALKSLTGDEAQKTLPADFLLDCHFTDTDMTIQLTDKEGKSLKASFEKILSDGVCDRKETKNLLKRELYRIFREYTGRDLSWGTLSGIRPTKITSALLSEGMPEEEVFAHMQKDYYLSENKARECIAISRRELAVLNRIRYREGYSLYVGIPFCPSTCLYCSFTSYPIGKYAKRMEEYLDALLKELTFCAQRYRDKRLCTIYIGGGTPTSLSAEGLDRLLSKISELYDTKKLYEFTIEAGRPDSITPEKLRVIRKYDITRISINPQTMQDETLRVIGRHHTTEQFLKAYALAREEGFDNINMDFILGLPGEEIRAVRSNMEYVKRLQPDSLTIHSLAIKRAARLNLEQRLGKQFDIRNDEEMMQVTKDTAKELNLFPYYLYRQKNMAGNLENVGYAKEGKEGIYNILIMEEKQTILAVGAGASSKMVRQDTDNITRIENVKDVDLYIDKIDEMIRRKQDYMEKEE